MYKSSLRLAQHFRSLPVCYPASAVSCTNTLTNSETRCCCRLPTRYVTTGSASQYFKDILDNGKYNLSNALKRVGVLDLSRSRLRRNAYYMYSDIADNFDFKYFFQKFNLPDTFNSWFVVMELHLWMTLVRLMAEAEEGRFVRNIIIEAMWEDITQKTGLLGAENTSIARSQIKVMNEEFQAALLGYDEGLLSDDTVLAGALWRRFFSKDCNDPELLEILVRYVRRQVKHFDSLTRDDVLLHRKFLWFPVDDDK